MENIEFEHLTYSDRKAIEERAHQLRAQALRDTGIVVGNFFSTGFHKITNSLTSYRQKWVGVRLEATPPLKS